jgi:predicted nucleic acid-binding protein
MTYLFPVVRVATTDPIVESRPSVLRFNSGGHDCTGRRRLQTLVRPVGTGPCGIGAYDVLLAGQARRNGATLVTANANEFARVVGLKWEDWAVSRR